MILRKTDIVTIYPNVQLARHTRLGALRSVGLRDRMNMATARHAETITASKKVQGICRIPTEGQECDKAREGKNHTQ